MKQMKLKQRKMKCEMRAMMQYMKRKHNKRLEQNHGAAQHTIQGLEKQVSGYMDINSKLIAMTEWCIPVIDDLMRTNQTLEAVLRADGYDV